MKWYDIRRVEEGEVGWRFLLVLGLVEDNDVHRGYNYNVWNSGGENYHRDHVEGVFNTRTILIEGGILNTDSSLKASNSRTKKMTKLQ